MPGIADNIKAQAIAAGLGEITGKKPMVYEQGGRLIVGWKDTDVPVVSDMLQRQFQKLADQPPGPVQVDFAPVVLPVAAKMYGAQAALGTIGFVALGVGLGYLLWKKG